ncbi:hypothetical protein D0T53_05680 [Dysgonomonas sp. 216]|uniref:fimbrillin family protein n=1 Tax=Dysgonomonas sp. 216 TaxID=2302934 RepID=UPI0013D6820E|nr:fimbrillin family protein [Dysgonomonas sp. 216]NDW18405.1 hypothetical protein [Dysgonomonas sp. 216]
MKKLFLFIATIALTLASCSNDEDLGFVDNGTSDAIEFRTLTDKSSNLRAAITNGDNILSFTVTGIKSMDNDYLFNAFGITRGENDSWAYTPKRYWPTDGTVDFLAYSPSSSKNLTISTGLGLTDFVPGTSLLKYTVPEIDETNAQEDFLVAQIKKQNKNSGTVKLNFHHALSRVMFFAKTSQKNITYTIESVELLQLNQTGTLDISNDSIAESGTLAYGSDAFVLWKDQETPVDYAVDMGASPIYLLNEYKSILGKTGAMLVLPQATKISTNGTGKTAPASGEFAIKVAYKAFVDDIYYAGSAAAPEVKYFAVKDINGKNKGITFEMGRQYNFYLGFGEDVSGEVSFEVGVSPWSDTPDQYIPELDNYAPLISNELAKKANSAFDPTNNNMVTAADIASVTEELVATGDFGFKGIEYFKGVTKLTLNNVTGGGDLDISKNPLITEVAINGSTLGDVNLLNGTLAKLAFSGNNTFTSLDASNNNKLDALTFASTTKIDGDLNLSNNPSLIAVDLSGVTINGASPAKFDLDLSNCSLTTFTMTSGKMTNLNLSNNKFVTLSISNSTFENLDISNNTLLKTFNFEKSSVRKGTGVSGTGLLNAKGNTALERYETVSPGSGSDVYVINNFDISDSKNIKMMNIRYAYTINVLTVWDGCTQAYLNANNIVNIHSNAGDKGLVNIIKTVDGTQIKPVPTP